jgi:hypothetical protein
LVSLKSAGSPREAGWKREPWEESICVEREDACAFRESNRFV